MIFSLSIASVYGEQHLSEVVFSDLVGFSFVRKVFNLPAGKNDMPGAMET